MTTLLLVISLVSVMGRPLSRAPCRGSGSSRWPIWNFLPEASLLGQMGHTAWSPVTDLSSRTNSSNNTAGCLSRCKLDDRCWLKKFLPRLHVSNFKKWLGFWLGLHQVHTFEKLDIFTILRLPIQKCRTFSPLFIPKILTVF